MTTRSIDTRFFVPLLLFLSQQIFAQNDMAYEPQFERLKKYHSAPQGLLKHLDSIFSNGNNLKLKTGENLDNYLDRRIDSTLMHNSFNDSQEPFYYVIKNDLFDFNEDYTYSLQEPKNLTDEFDLRPLYPDPFESLSEKDDANELISINKKVFTDMDGVLVFNKNLEYKIVLKNFILPKFSASGLPPSYVENSIVETALGANYYNNCIIEDDRFVTSFYSKPSRNKFRFKNYPYGNYCSIENSYVKRFEMISKVQDFSIWNSKVDSLFIYNDSVQTIDLNFRRYRGNDGLFFFTDFNDESGKGNVYGGSFYEPEEFFLNEKWTYLHLQNLYSKNVNINTNIGNLFVRDVEIENDFNITKRLDSIFMYNIDASQIRISFDSIEKSEKTKIFFYDVDFDKLDIQWFGFEIYKPHETWSDEKINSLYRELLASFKKKGYDSSYEELDKQFKEWTYKLNNQPLFNWIDKNWWDYGYNKSLVFRNTFILFFFFVLVNSLFLKYFSKNLYSDEKIYNMIKKRNSKFIFVDWVVRLPASMFYTAKVFFGVGFKYDKLRYEDKLNNLRLIELLYFFLVFITGLICLGHIVNLVITK